MTLKIGWFSTGRDPAARNLLKAVNDYIIQEKLPAEISWVFCHRETGDGPFNEEYKQREMFFDLAAGFDIPVATLSHVKFLPELRKRGVAESVTAEKASSALQEWRDRFGMEVVRVVSMMSEVDIIVMAGYMLIIGKPELEAFDMVNIHPALPWGPKGTWQEVIHKIIAEDASEQGIMVHLVTGELDRGPVISYSRFPIKGLEWNEFWTKWKVDIQAGDGVEKRESHPLFRKIRHEGEIRELPLLNAAIREIAIGEIVVRNKKIFAHGGTQESGLDLTSVIEKYISSQSSD
ncbi:MAG: phosphoribosylglycinamide formyltransferase [Desulfomonilaceae bacterium]